MESNSKQKKTTAKSRSSSSGGTAKKRSTSSKTTTRTSSAASARSGRRTKKKKARPFRREIGGLVCLLLALLTFAGNCGINALMIDPLAKLERGLTGWGHNLWGICLLWMAAVLIFHHGRPVWARIISILTVPSLMGGIVFLMLNKAEQKLTIPELWTNGIEKATGGVLAGGAAQLLAGLISKWIAVLVLLVLLAAVLMIAARTTPMALWERFQSRERYEEEPERPRRYAAEEERAAARDRIQIDIPMDDDPAEAARRA